MNWSTYAAQQSNSKVEKQITRLMNAAPLKPNQCQRLVKLLRQSGNYSEFEITYMVNYTK